MALENIVIKGARANNLKNIDLTLPRDKFIVFTGVSGSGKSSLAFETIYAEGQRRYVESLSSYARQFLGQMEKPDVDLIEGLSPAISIDQKSTNHNPRSTVGTVTEIYDYLRLLYARVGVPHCPKCGKEIKKQTIDQIVDQVMQIEAGSKIQILAPIVRERKGQHVKVLENAKKSGYVRVRVDGSVYDLNETIDLDKNKKHTIEVVVDRLVVKDGIQKRLSESVETVMGLSEGLLTIDVNGNEDLMFSQNFACIDCGISITEIEPRSFSFNNPSGACEECHGLGRMMKIDPELCVPNQDLTINQGAIAVGGWNTIANGTGIATKWMEALSKLYDIDLDKPFKELTEEQKNIIFFGPEKELIVPIEYEVRGEIKIWNAKYEGLVNATQRRYEETTSEASRAGYEALMTDITCPKCKGKRLNKLILGVTVGDKNIADNTPTP